MLARWKRTALSLVAVLAVFGVYRVLAEPFIEPPAQQTRRTTELSADDLKRLQQKRLQNRLGDYLQYFPEGAWERGNPLVAEGDNTKLLWKEYETLPDGKVRLTPCTVIVTPRENNARDAEPADGAAERGNRGRVIIMQAPDGAVVEFNEPAELSRGLPSRFVGCDLNGPVTVFSGATRPEGGDDLLVTTRNVQVNENVIYTPHEVDFRFGDSHGHGREMRIELLPAADGEGRRRGPNVGGVETLELLRDVQMHLQRQSAGLMPGVRRGEAGGIDTQSPMDIRCAGPFQFDLVRNVATFHDDVKVTQQNADGPADQVDNCDELSVTFAPRQATPNGRGKQQPATAGGLSRLEARKFAAKGNPVIVRAPSSGLEARARSFNYERGPHGGLLGNMESAGPGWIAVTPPDDPARRFEARWSQELRMRPQDENYLLSVLGDAWASYAGQGQLGADAIHVWLYELPPQPDAATPSSGAVGGRNVLGSRGGNGPLSRIQPVKMLAEGRVRIESPQLSGAIGRMEAWFRSAGSAAAGPLTGAARSKGARGERPENDNAVPRRERDAERPHFEIKRGELLQARLVTGRPPDLEHLVLKNDVWLVQTPTGRNGDEPLDIRGDELQVLRANGSRAEMTVIGRPARVGAGGMTMFGPAVQMDQAANRAWIDGAGRMTFDDMGRMRFDGDRRPQSDDATAAQRDARQRDLFAAGGSGQIEWQGNMAFDGLTARFERDVIGHQTEPQGPKTPERKRTIRAPDGMEVTLQKRIDFIGFNASPSRQSRPEVEQTVCRGEVTMESRETQDGKVRTIEQLQTRDLSMNRRTGDLVGQGPGRLRRWFLGRPLEMNRGPAGAAPGRANRVDPNQIQFMEVEFQNGLCGNVDRGEMTLVDQVRGVYGPVPAWDARLDIDDPNGPGPGVVVLNSDELTVSESGPPINGEATMEMMAVGNIWITGQRLEGDTFTATAPRMTYSEAKDLIILSSIGRSGVQIIRQARPGAPQQRMPAREVHISPSGQHFSTDGGSFIEAGRLENRPPSRPRAPAPKPTAPPTK